MRGVARRAGVIAFVAVAFALAAVSLPATDPDGPQAFQWSSSDLVPSFADDLARAIALVIDSLDDNTDDEVLGRVVERVVEAPTRTAPLVPVQVAAPSPPNHQRRGEAALARMPISPASVGFTISFEPPRSGFGGLTFPDTRHIEIYVDGGWSDAHLAHIVAHEIGHAVDMARNSRTDHERWRAARGIPASTGWWADPYTSDFATPGGDFAECFAIWANGGGHSRSRFGGCGGTAALISDLVQG